MYFNLWSDKLRYYNINCLGQKLNGDELPFVGSKLTAFMN